MMQVDAPCMPCGHGGARLREIWSAIPEACRRPGIARSCPRPQSGLVARLCAQDIARCRDRPAIRDNPKGIWRLRGKSGLTFHQEIVNSGMRIPVVFMTGHGVIEMSVKAMKAGAMDFFAKPFRDQDMLDTVSQALARDKAGRTAEAAVAELRLLHDSPSPREKEVLVFVLSGLLNKKIDVEMNLNEIAVKVHRGQVMRNFNARSMPDLVRKAELLGIQPFVPGGAH
jgi:FixJ family two-component response regulator